MSLSEVSLIVGIVLGVISIVAGVAKGISWYRRRLKRARDREVQAARLLEDLEAELLEVTRREEEAYQSADNELVARNVFRSGMRGMKHLKIAEQCDRARTQLVGEWRRAMEDLGFPIAEPPPSANVRPTTFHEAGKSFSRYPNPSDDPIHCGCGRLVYLVDGVSWWCPEHEFAVS